MALLSVNMLNLASRVVNNEFTSTIISVILIKYDQTNAQSSLIEVAPIEEKNSSNSVTMCAKGIIQQQAIAAIDCLENSIDDSRKGKLVPQICRAININCKISQC